MAKKLVFTTNNPSATTDYAAADGTWKTMSGGGGSGTVTSVAVTVPAALSVSGSPITTSGTIAISGAGTASQYIKGDGTLGTTATALPPSGSAGGDLSGTYPNPTVSKIHGVDMQSGTPSADDVWVYGGSPAKWQHQKLHSNQVTNDSTVTGTNVDNALDNLKSAIALKQDTLVSGTNIKTVNSTSLLGSGDVAVQATLVSGTNIKTVNSNSLLGSGNISVGTVTSVAALTLGTSGTDLGSSVATGTTTPVITLNVPTASATNRGALSSTDWSTFNNKQDTITGAATTVTTSNLTANRAVISNGSGKIAVSTATDTEVGYLSGVTSAIQSQLNAKQGTLTLTTTGSSGSASLVGNTLNVPQYASSGSGTSFLTGSYALSTVGASTTTYSTLTGGSMNPTENYRLTLIPQTCTISRMYFSTLTTQSATGSLVVTLRKNNADTALTLTVAAGSVAGTFSDTTNSVSFTAGQNASVKLQNNATATSCQTNCISFLVTI